ADLSQLLLSDSVNIFMNNQPAVRHRKKFRNKNQQIKTGRPPLYLHKHVMDAAERMVAIAFNRPFAINDFITLEFIPTGHLLGAAAAHLTLIDQGHRKTMAFTGDIGRKNAPVLVDPESLPATDYL